LLFKFIITIFLALFSLQISFAKDSNQKHNMFIDIKHGEAISKTNKYDDHESTPSRRVINADGNGIDGTKSFGIGFGKKLNNDYNFVTSIEQVDSIFNHGTQTLLNGTKWYNVNTKYNAKSIIFEVERNFNLNPKYKFFINGGLGFSKFSINANDHQVTSVTGNVYNVGLKNSNNDVLTRFGFGISKVINENLQLVTSIDYTDRGEAEWKEADGDILDLHIKSTNAVIKLRYYFK
jgi:hypothetical protein